MTYVIYNPNHKPADNQKKEIVDFLFTHLEQYGDEKEDILAAVNFAVRDALPSLGGFVLVAKEKGTVTGMAVVNHTGMKGYIPEHVLVYVATHREMRGEGIGRSLVEKVMALAEGDLALHVDAGNPAVRLYEELGFENKYMEMRYSRKR